MPIRVERNFDNRMAYLITHIRGRLTLGDMPRSEEVPEIVKPGRETRLCRHLKIGEHPHQTFRSLDAAD